MRISISESKVRGVYDFGEDDTIPAEEMALRYQKYIPRSKRRKSQHEVIELSSD